MVLAAAVVDVVTADLRRDPRSEAFEAPVEEATPRPTDERPSGVRLKPKRAKKTRVRRRRRAR
jgi:hypothetical protein